MKYFFRNVSAFFLFPVIVLIIIELYLGSYPLTFQKQYSFFKKNMTEIELLILGSSHNYDAINPEYIDGLVTANNARGSQDIELDYKLLNKYIAKMVKLKYVMVDLSYHNLEHDVPDDYYFNTLYLRYYGINNFGRPVRFIDYSILYSSPSVYVKLLNPFKKRPVTNKYGILKDYSVLPKHIMRFENFNYNDSIIYSFRDNYFINRHKKRKLMNFKKNSFFFNKIVKLCDSLDVRLIIVMPPVHDVYYQEMLPAKKQKRDEFIDSLFAKNPKIKLWNFENSKRFQTKDFKNEDHLNLPGSVKFSNQINDSLNKLNHFEKMN